ncbi:MAG: ankyrin repeat domain-containing protein [Acidobacteria bacterium]|nr:ankyrin repeat domain-containing protein [Acidobacteriota bacterium]
MLRPLVSAAALVGLAISMGAQPAPGIFEAIQRNDIAAVKAAPADQVNATGPLGLTPLMAASAFGSLEAIQALLERDAAVNAKDPRDGTALMYGAWDPARTKLLIEKGAEVNAASKQGRTALLVAAGSPGAVGSVQLLLQSGANPTARDQRGFNLLIPAAAGSAAFAGMLIDKGFDVKTAADGTGFSPLMLAAGLGNLDSVKLLLAKGSDVNAANTFGGRVKFGDIALKGLTPLMLASPTGSPELIKTLIAAGANVNAQDSRGMTPLMFALSTENQNVAAAKVLIAAGAKLDIKSTVGETAADWVRKFQHPESLNLARPLRPPPPARPPNAPLLC